MTSKLELAGGAFAARGSEPVHPRPSSRWRNAASAAGRQAAALWVVVALLTVLVGAVWLAVASIPPRTCSHFGSCWAAALLEYGSPE